MSIPTSQTLEVTGDGYTIGFSSDGTTWTYVAEVTKPVFEGRKNKVVPTTHLGSTEETSQPSKIPAPGTLEFEFNFSKTIAATIETLQLAGTYRQWKVQAPDGTTSSTGSKVVGLGYVTEFNPFSSIVIDEVVPAKVVIQFSGPLAFTAAT